MLRVSGPQDTWWEVLPEQARQLPAELAQIGAYLDDEQFIAPLRAVIVERLGRPSVPVETVLRLLYLKHRYQFGYETLCRDVADSLRWRRFCRILLTSPVPHPTALVKLVRRSGPQAIEQLNAALLGKLVEDGCCGASVFTGAFQGRRVKLKLTCSVLRVVYPCEAAGSAGPLGN